VELDKAAASTYAANFSEELGNAERVFAGDIKEWDPGDLGTEVDVILGGPPCQGFSNLGKNDPDDPRNQLWREYVRVVEKLEPKIFVIENVDRFLSPKNREFALLQAAMNDGPLKNYELRADHLVAADFGAPQKRKRAIVLATHKDLAEVHGPLTHPHPTHSDPNKIMPGLWEHGEGPQAWVTAESVFGQRGRPKTVLKPRTTDLPDRWGNPLGLNKELPGAFRTPELHIGRNPTPLSIRRYKAIPPGGNRHHIKPEDSTESWLNHKSGSHDVMGRMYLDQPSVTIRTEFYKPEKGRYLHPWAHRPITHYEAARLQGFPDDFLWYGSKIDIATQIGNAVPVDLSRALAGQIHRYLVAAGVVQASPTIESAA
jgi:DNA (cytosine-5)-methyltransferase 1